jgi:hypothetical protein
MVVCINGCGSSINQHSDPPCGGNNTTSSAYELVERTGWLTLFRQMSRQFGWCAFPTIGAYKGKGNYSALAGEFP